MSWIKQQIFNLYVLNVFARYLLCPLVSIYLMRNAITHIPFQMSNIKYFKMCNNMISLIIQLKIL